MKASDLEADCCECEIMTDLGFSETDARFGDSSKFAARYIISSVYTGEECQLTYRTGETRCQGAGREG